MNPEIFSPKTNPPPPVADTVNDAGGAAYSLSPHAALAQYVCTGTLNKTYYVNAETQLEKVIGLCKEVEPEFIAKCALYAHERAHMKDMPALLLAVLASRDNLGIFALIFDRIITNGKMLRNFCQVIRSGVTGRKSFGYRPRKMVSRWLRNKDDVGLLIASIGNSPTLGDIIKMVHPKPSNPQQDAMFAYLTGRHFNVKALSPLVQEYIKAKKGAGPVTDNMLKKLPHRLLTNFELSTHNWQQIALYSGWTAKRMNLNSFAKHGVFDGDSGKLVSVSLSEELANPHTIKRAKAFPYQLLTTWKNVVPEVPKEVTDALEKAMEVALENIPTIEGSMAVLVDTSGSMSWSITGERPGSSSTTRCVDVAALVASAFLRKNPDNCKVIPFDTKIHRATLNPEDSVFVNSEKLCSYYGGGTDVSCGLKHLNEENHSGDLVIIVSDNQSWLGQGSLGTGMYGQWNSNNCTETLKEWGKYKRRNARAKLVCIDLTPNGTSQAPDDGDIINVGGFSDEVFNVIEAFTRETGSKDYWSEKIRDFRVTC